MLYRGGRCVKFHSCAADMIECGLDLASRPIPNTSERLALNTVTFVHKHTMNTPNSLLNFNIVPLKPRVSQRSCNIVPFQWPLRDSIVPFGGNGAEFYGAECFGG